MNKIRVSGGSYLGGVVYCAQSESAKKVMVIEENRILTALIFLIIYYDNVQTAGTLCERKINIITLSDKEFRFLL